MQPSDFAPDAPGRLFHSPRGYWAFIPNPLPPTLAVDWELVSQISNADRALSELAGVGRTLPNPHLLIGPFIRREAVLSSRIEGTQASFSDLLFFEASGIADPRPDVREVANYVRALEYGLARMNELPLSLRLIREIHERLMSGVRGDHLTPGEFRRSQNWIGAPGYTLMEATFVPPPEDDMKTALGDLEIYWHTPPTLPPLVRLALIHYQFEVIHPFLDGNGRMGRLLMTLLLCAEGLLNQPLLYLSAYFERYRDDYYRHLLAVSQRNAWRNWIDFFLRGIADQALDAVQRSAQLMALREEYRNRLPAISGSIHLLRLMGELFSYPAITIAQVAERLNITSRAAGLNVEKLEKAGLLKEITGQKRYRVFIAPDIVSIIEAPHSSAVSPN